jgi:hypothetical protein
MGAELIRVSCRAYLYGKEFLGAQSAKVLQGKAYVATPASWELLMLVADGAHVVDGLYTIKPRGVSVSVTQACYVRVDSMGWYDVEVVYGAGLINIVKAEGLELVGDVVK